MKNIFASIFKKVKQLSNKTKVILGGGLVLIIIILSLFWPKAAVHQFITVKAGPIDEMVSVTGNTAPLSSVSLGFGNSGNIARIASSVGKNVVKGQVLAELNTSDIYSQVRQAQASVNNQKAAVAAQQASLSSQRAKLQGVQAGSRPEDIATSQASLDKSVQDLANLYSSINDISLDSHAKAQDAVRVQLDQFFSNAETSNAKLTYQSANSQAASEAEMLRFPVAQALNKWQTEISTSGASQTELDNLIKNGLAHLDLERSLLNSLSKTLDNAPSLSTSAVTSYRASLTAAINEVNTAAKNLNSISQNIASQKLTITQLQAQLDLKKSGSTPQDIMVQQAQVENAEAAVQGALASVQSAEATLQGVLAKLQNSQIIAPISGVITQFDAKVGQFASPGNTLISIISPSDFEVSALVSEIDVGKISLNNKVTMTIDAFPGETFTGTVFYIDPAQTTSGGVVGYKIKVTFDKPDARMKSGLTVNIDINTRHKDNVLYLPQSAILQNDEGTFVQVLENKTVKNLPVTLGLQDQKGNVEITSGVSLDEQVLNIGLK
ncbi:MAG: hypothetical protein JWN37_341 [Candidatus Nomurabacteria bacterium]|nr:hypothetical protein [Candidatus Nomurabacteria bacterium]